MSRLNARRAMDPRWPYHQRSVPIGHMTSVCEIFRRTGDATYYGFDIKTGGLVDTSTGSYPGMALLYRGQVRGATNKDWRARVQTSRGDMGVQHTVRFQVPIRMCPPIHSHDVLRVVSSPPDQELTHYIFHVRNVMMSTPAWIRNLLCDVDVAHPQLLPPPYEGDPLPVGDLPPPASECMSCSG